jgi:TPP-dependent pyruvate/acetoin dehydrogenase alpha subunit
MAGVAPQVAARAASLAAPEQRRQLYREMLRIRLVEERIAARYPEQEMRCPTHLCIGQEAPPVGVSAHLRKDDLVFSGHRSHGHYLAKGGSLKSMLAELYGRETGCARGKGGSQHLIDLECGFMGSAPILASTISVGVGAAWAAKLDRRDQVVAIYFGDGATEEGAFHEALNFASVHRLPAVFVCENNLYSVHSALDVRQPRGRPIHMLASAHDIVGVRGNGNDVDEIYRLAGEAVARARAGAGPTLIELATYRWLEHCGPNDDAELLYRSGDELEEWKRKDPVRTYSDRLLAEGILTVEWMRSEAAEIEHEIDEAFSFARGSPFPPSEALAQFVYPE